MVNSSGYRSKFTRVKTAKSRKISSTNWLKRQLNDPYVERSRMDGYRSRAAYKLIEINEKFNILKPGLNVVDLGAAPGGWSQIAAKIIKSDADNAKNYLIALDLLEMDHIPGVRSIQNDFQKEETREMISQLLDGQKVDIVLSDMAANTTGHKATDHLRILNLCEIALDFALKNLSTGGHFVAKIFRGGTENELLKLVKQNFSIVKHFKPKSSRKESSEFYLVAINKK